MNFLPIFKNAKELRNPLYSVFDSGIKQKTVDENIVPAAETAEKILKNDTDKFTIALAHEIRNPLTNINLSVQMLECEIQDDKLRMYLDIINRSSVRINGMLNEVLKNRQLAHEHADNYSIHQLLDEVLEMTGDRITLKNITVSREYAEQGCQVAMNKSEMKVALTNIFINAIDAMPFHNGVLKLVTTSDGTLFILRIADNGCGISKENLKNIFKPYFTNKPGGIGLGLSATHEILLSNHIGVTVESKENVGTCFTLLFKKELQL